MVQNCLYSRLSPDSIEKIEAELKNYPLTTGELINILKSKTTFFNMPYGQVVRLCDMTGVSLDSPWDAISEW